MTKQYLDNFFSLNEKFAVVIGAAGHLCSEMARGFARSGCKVALLDLNLDGAKSVEAELNEEGYKNIISQKIDVTKKEDHIAALDHVVTEFGSVDILINGAGVNSASPFLKYTTEEWNDVLTSVLSGTVLGCQVIGEHMVYNKKGSIINNSSASAGPPLSKAFAYSVAKAGVKNLTQNLGREWAKAGVRVNAIRPGFFQTEWNKKNFITPDREKAILNHTPMNRFGEPNELLGAVFWLSSDASSFVTGAEIVIDGGFSCMTI